MLKNTETVRRYIRLGDTGGAVMTEARDDSNQDRAALL